jgi:spermidine dehydrogenase
MPQSARAANDARLGMDQPITRRDFLDGAALVLGAAAIGGCENASAPSSRPTAQNPARRLGDRGHHPGSHEVAHALRDGTFWKNAGAVQPTGESYDLVVVGGGISGLAAAVEYSRTAGARTRVLVLENHDDFGGHANRNEFVTRSGRVVIGYGGSQSLQTPSYFSPAVAGLVRSLDIDLEKFETEFFDESFTKRHGLAPSHLFCRELFGRDVLVRDSDDFKQWATLAPLSARARSDLIALVTSPRDYLPGKSAHEKRALLASMTYRQFLLDIVGVDPQIALLYQDSTAAYFGVGIDGTSALDACANGNPGFDAMALGELADPAMSPSGRLAYTDPDRYVYHFPDGNHGLARALVRELIPSALAGRKMEDLVTGSLRYERLDEPAARARLRLQSTVVRVRETDGAIEVSYVRDGRLESVAAKHVVLACWHRVIPLIVPGLPSAQAQAMQDQHKVPLIYANVLLSNWHAFARLNIDSVQAVGHFWRGAELDFPVSIGRYRFPRTPDEPMLLHVPTVLTEPGLPPRAQAAAGRRRLATLTFEELERSIRDLLARALGAGGFEPARDIEGICVNRWAHGYAYEYMRPWDSYWPNGPLPIEKARQRFGNIAIANADAGAYAYAHSAIDQAIRAVRELVGAPPSAPAFASRPGPDVPLA